VRSLLHKSDELTRLVIAFEQQGTATVCAPNWWSHSGFQECSVARVFMHVTTGTSTAQMTLKPRPVASFL
jgi:hypothetical protein